MVEVERLLADCLQDARAGSLGALPMVAEGSAYEAARHTFLAAGLRALRDDLPETGWVQLNLAPWQGAWPALYRRLTEAAHELTGSGLARDFFFMHKPPGLRVRFHAARPADAGTLRDELVRRFDQGDGAWTRPTVGVYEPETYLFGGPRSMPLVHALFTADSLAWLDHHTAQDRGTLPADWRVSLTLLRALLDGLGIVGWEHRGVWQVVREDTGRRLVEGLRGPSRQRAATGIRAYWDLSCEEQLDALPEAWRGRLRAHQDAVHRAATRWRTGYFEAGDAVVGPRRAAAHYAIFHWNRARFSLARQSLLTEALAEAPGEAPGEARGEASGESRGEAAGLARAEDRAEDRGEAAGPARAEDRAGDRAGARADEGAC
ncbi:thiopeptide-type bacteriocin biosynthesis protein [Streptomyces ficellus]|uniref:Thiopeptide-type bacteriocin biosynthesis protein n=1 Tax=Streptomyces ficellus TaxID=1977088 RepID=A0ABT7ZDH7_9ACTN|nr:thiopeptide-type bacteriocin biosynthesis protein [Streptomyces ficellus]MDN3297554.1 thiopeptide-type bacteriocin biosynthesis protein [Streptomyces ficellus]